MCSAHRIALAVVGRRQSEVRVRVARLEQAHCFEQLLLHERPMRLQCAAGGVHLSPSSERHIFVSSHISYMCQSVQERE